MEECGFCKERNNRIKNYEEEIEKEKVIQCQKSLEREKIAKGMQCTKNDEIRLKDMQLMQMQEKKLIEAERQQVETMWHELLLDTVRMKEQYERQEANRLKKEMVERRLFYEGQIASANKKQREAIKNDRDTENKRLEKMKKKMEEEYYEDIKKKKEIQQRNKKNYIDDHENKLIRIRNIKKQERELDNKTIRAAIEDLNREKQQRKNRIQTLRIDEQIFLDHSNKERKMTQKLEQETDNIIVNWEHRQQNKIEEKIKSEALKRIENKKNAAHEYRTYVEQKKREKEKAEQERFERMNHVKGTAMKELIRNLDSANEELRRQIQYRNNLTNQIKENQKFLEAEIRTINSKQRPFEKTPNMFIEAMADKINKSRASTNPVHPFRRILERQSAVNNSKLILPSIQN